MFEGLKDIYEEYINYGGQPQYVERALISEDDLKTLKAWLVNSTVPFKGFSGKLYFGKVTKFPRYKFTEYSRNHNQIVRRVRKIDNSDAAVIDVEQYEKMLDNCLSNTCFSKQLSANYNNTGIPSFKFAKENENKTTFQLYYKIYHKYDSSYRQLEFLSWLYTNYIKNNFKLISVFDLSQNLGKQYEAISAVRAKQLSNLLESKDSDNIKLGMEIMTNCDLEASYFHLSLLFEQFGRAMKAIAYWHSTSFKAFREAFDGLGLYCENIMGINIINVTEKYLKLSNKFLFEEDVEYIKNLIREELKENYNFEETGYELAISEINLNIDPLKIIKSAENNKDVKDVKDIEETEVAENIV